MKHHLLPTPRSGTQRTVRSCVAALFASFAVAVAASAQAPGFAKLQGFVIDSVHNGPLVKAVVLVEGVSRQTMTDADGHYALDSIPPGDRRVMVLSAVLDTLGFSMRTPPQTFTAGKTTDLDLSIPSP